MRAHVLTPWPECECQVVRLSFLLGRLVRKQIRVVGINTGRAGIAEDLTGSNGLLWAPVALDCSARVYGSVVL